MARIENHAHDKPSTENSGGQCDVVPRLNMTASELWAGEKQLWNDIFHGHNSVKDTAIESAMVVVGPLVWGMSKIEDEISPNCAPPVGEDWDH